MKPRYSSVLFKMVFLFTLIGIVNQKVIAKSLPTPPNIQAKAWLLMSFDSGQIIAGKNIQQELSPASLTKIMTAYVVGKEINNGNIDLSDVVTISDNANSSKFHDSSKMLLKENQKVTLEQLLKGIVIASGNDATIAIAEHIAGHSAGFIDLMNQHAEALGMKNTYFSNPHGLDSEQQVTSAQDMALLTQALIQDQPEIYALFKEKSFTYRKTTQNNRNGLLWDKNLMVDGVKTGYTSKAGYSLITSAVQNNQRLIAVVMGATSATQRQRENKKLLQWGFRFFKDITPDLNQDTLDDYKIWYGSPSRVSIETRNGNMITVPRHQGKHLSHEVIYETFIDAPQPKGTQIGQINWYIKDALLTSQPLVITEDVIKAPWYSIAIDKAWRPASELYHKINQKVQDSFTINR